MYEIIPFSEETAMASLAYYNRERKVLQERLTILDHQWQRIETEYVQARNTCHQKLQHYLTEVVHKQLQLASLKKHCERPGDQSAHSNMRICEGSHFSGDAQYVFYATARLLFKNGSCMDNRLFDEATKAYREGKFDLLYSCYEEANRLLGKNIPVPFMKNREFIQRRLLDTINACRFMRIAASIIEQRIDETERSPLFKAHKSGKNHFNTYCQRLIAEQKRELRQLDEEIEIAKLNTRRVKT